MRIIDTNLINHQNIWCMKENKTGEIYLVCSKVTGKMYIGQTCRSFDIRWKEHCTDSFNSNSISYNDHFHKAIRLYGIDNWDYKILKIFSCSSKELLKKQLNASEIKYIALYDTFKNGYNSTKGGDGVVGLKPFAGKKHTDKTKEIISKKAKERPIVERTSEWNSNLSKAHINNQNYIDVHNKLKKTVFQIKDGIIIGEFPSAKDACIQLGLPLQSRSDIQKCCRGVNKKCYNYEWKYKE